MMSMTVSRREHEARGREQGYGRRPSGDDARALTQPAHPAATRRAVPLALKLLPIWLMLYLLLNIADLLTTRIGLHLGLQEGNPLMNRLLTTYGFTALIVYKLVVMVVVVLGVWLLRNSYPRVARTTIGICNLLVGGAVLLNLLQFVAL